MENRSEFTVAIGQEVHGRDGKLGDIRGVVVDADTDTVSELVVKHGTIFGSERLLPLSCVQRSDGSVLYTDLDEEQFSECDGFDAARYRTPDPDYSGPPGFDRASGHNMPYEYATAAGPIFFFQAGKPLGYPGGESAPPSETSAGMWRPAIKEGDEVLSSDYEKVGEVATLEFDSERGVPTRLVMKQGFIFKSETAIPAEWLAELSDRGVILSVPKDTVERYVDEAH
ncbi:MAG: hypothetical protein IT303_15410 [Dehalococcoidia bacterium]|nr:hypothetical protein [Dehalococcoidia bacterium]